MKNLVIVESPAKAKTIGKYLGNSYTVQASVGHIRDLPAKSLGVDVGNNFAPEYEIIKGKKKVIDDIKKSAQSADCVYLAPDPDREGEAIAWHVAYEIGKLKKRPPVHRVLFNEITKKAVCEAIQKPITINQDMFEAQQARRILDRLVGYQISPLLWDKVRRGLSAGRVQSVAVRLVCEREDEIRAFKPEEYSNIEVLLEGSAKPTFTAHLSKEEGKKIEVGNGDKAKSIVDVLKKSSFVLSQVNQKEQRRHPSPPFITSKLQQEASRKLGFTAKKTMMLAQKLYEGIEVEGELAGLITYMRTDSTRVSDLAISEVRDFINQTFGKNYLPETPHFYKSKKGAQDAHEAIRPTSMKYTPDLLKSYLKKDEQKLYELIWKRFVASQMASAILDQTVFVVTAGPYELRASGSILKFPGFISVYTEGRDEESRRDDEQAEEDREGLLPQLVQGEILNPLKFDPTQHFTQPPPRFTEATLVKELEEKGIGRPSTYASILSVIQDKGYVEKNDQRKFRPTDLGVIVNNLLVANFPDILDAQFTARMEGELDDVEEGKIKWVEVLKEFYQAFSKDLEVAKVKMKNIKRQETPTDIACEKCGSTMVIKFGRNGEFLACSKYPDCKSTKEFKRDDEGKIKIIENEQTNEVCEKCGAPMVVKRGKFGSFLACSTYPACKTTKAVSIGVNCPTCGKPLAARKTKRGKIFYGCTAYPNCTFASWDKPVNQPCPQCQHPFLVEKVTKSRGEEIRCAQKGCGYVQEMKSEAHD